MKDKKKQGLILSILAVLTVVLITGGVTYAFFNYASEGTTDNVIETDIITFLYTEVAGVGNGIKIENAYPISDEQGKLLTKTNEYFDFKVTSKTASTIAIPYEVTARKSTNSDDIDEYVRVYLTKDNQEVLLDNYNNLTQTSRVDDSKYTEKTIYTGKVPANTANYEEEFRLRMWIDEDTRYENEVMNDKTFTLTVNVYANAKVVTEEEKELETNNEISSIEVGEKKAIMSYSNEYDYEIGLESGTTSTNLTIETDSPDTEVRIEKLDSLSSTNNIKRLASTKSVKVTEGDNYFKITTTSLTGEEKTSIINVRVGEYKESILNDADPVLKDTLIPVIIKDNGDVQKVDTTYSWYDYETKNWANAVILRDTDTYKVGEIIKEEDIESYFVWIPKYSYKLWDLGNYTGITSINTSKVHVINIKFGLNNTSDSSTGECTTPGVAGSSGNCSVGDYMTHPAFLAFDTNGLWVGKFETGFDGADVSTNTEMNTYDKDKIIIKPNVYSWRNNTLGNMFKASFDYLRENESHMMKNTEWGAVAYLQHSEYGSAKSVRFNNNKDYITGYASTEEPTVGYNNQVSIEGNRNESTLLGVDGEYTVNYLNSKSKIASTTGNYTGIYDMSGGTWEYVIGYTSETTGSGDSSKIVALYNDFFTNDNWKKYYDKYSSTAVINFNNRILGDATGEMGPFGSEEEPNNAIRNKASWYKNYSQFTRSSNSWFRRSGNWHIGSGAGIFTFSDTTGSISFNISFRVVLAPKEV